jgi:hypothetical protein
VYRDRSVQIHQETKVNKKKEVLIMSTNRETTKNTIAEIVAEAVATSDWTYEEISKLIINDRTKEFDHIVSCMEDSCVHIVKHDVKNPKDRPSRLVFNGTIRNYLFIEFMKIAKRENNPIMLYKCEELGLTTSDIKETSQKIASIDMNELEKMCEKKPEQIGGTFTFEELEKGEPDPNMDLEDIIEKHTECTIDQARHLADEFLCLPKLYDCFMKNVTADKINLYNCDTVIVKRGNGYMNDFAIITATRVSNVLDDGTVCRNYYVYTFGATTGMSYTAIE